ncbi:DUF5916 domain-containing protein [Gemmatimonadota bacterium]
MQRRISRVATSLLIGMLLVGAISLCPSALRAQIAPGPVNPVSDPAPAGPAVNDLNDSNISAALVQSNIRIDGTIDPEEWAGAPVISDFTARNPVEGADPSQRTEVRVLYSPTHLYIAYSCLDTDPDGIVYRVSTRDSWMLPSDKVQIDIDPYHDHRNSYHFIVGVANNQVDSYGMDINWDGVWESATTMTDEGWFVEIALPFSILRFEARDSHTFGINFSRTIQRTKEDLLWCSWGRDDAFRIDKYGELNNLQGLRRGRRLELMPYFKASGQQFYRSGGTLGYDRDGLADFGLDLKYGITSNMALDIALNPDFGQIAPDQEQINVTRYERYFMELRPFFQEGQGVFRTPLQIFYSRRIGKQVFGGPEVNMAAGAKLIGREGPWEIGVINAVTEHQDYTTSSGARMTVPMANYSVVRLKRDIFARSSIGIISVNKDSRSVSDTTRTAPRGTSPYQRALGLDLNLRFQDNHSITTMLAHSINHNGSGNDWAGQIKAGLRSDLWEYGVEFNYLGPDFNVDQIGYMTQVDRRRGKVNFGWKPRPEKFGVRRLEFKGSAEASRDFAGHYTHGRYRAEFKLQGMNYMELNASAGHNHTMWRDIYAPNPYDTDETSRPYDGQDFSVRFNTDRSLDYSFDASVNWGDFLDYSDLYWGRDLNVKGGFSFRASARFSGNLSLTHIREYRSNGDLDETKNLLVARASYYLTSNLALKVYNQYRFYTTTEAGERDDSANTLNAVLSWFLNAKSVLYLVYNEIRDDDIRNWEYYERYGRLPLSDRALLMKFTYWFNL